MKTRKTIEVSEIKNKLNDVLKNSTCSDSERLAIASVLEGFLSSTGNYRGFGYLDLEIVNGKPIIPNESRRHYY